MADGRRDRVRAALRRIFPDARREVDEESSFHREERVRDYESHGLDAESARRAADARLGDLGVVREECADLLEAEHRGASWRSRLDDARRDVVFGLRSARRAPVFAMAAVLTLALGIGANAALFGVVKSVLVDALPYEDGDELVRVFGVAAGEATGRSPLSPGAVVDIAARQRVFERMAAFFPTVSEVMHRTPEGPRVLRAMYAGPGFLETLGVRPVVGRAPTEAEIGADAFVVLLSWEYWQREYGGDRNAIGTEVDVDSDVYRVVGVLPRDFLPPMGAADLLFGMAAGSGSDASPSRSTHALGLVARLRAGVSEAAARRDLAGIGASLAREHPDTDGGLEVVSMRATLVGDTRGPLLALLGSAGLVLLLACVNLAGALLSRAITRRREFAVRAALGAGRGRLFRQLITESTLLGLGGAVVGLVLAAVALSALRRLALPVLPVFADLSLGAGAIGFGAVAALVAGLVIGIVPAWSARSSAAPGELRGSPRTAGDAVGSGRLRGALVAAQVALCLSLLAGAGLLARSLAAMVSTPLGYQPDGVFSVSVKGPIPAADVARKQFFEGLESRIGALPGVRAVATTDVLPADEPARAALEIRGVPWPASSGAPLVSVATVSDGYFRALGIPVRRGRVFGPSERMDTPPAVVISEGMARRYWPAGDALGARVRLGTGAQSPWGEVVGIVGDVRSDPSVAVPEPKAYLSGRQSLLRSIRHYLVRTTGDPLAFAASFRRQLAALDATVPMGDVALLRTSPNRILDGRRLPAALVTAFALLALALASVGVYALFAALAAARRQEFAVRMALGSKPLSIAALVLRQGGVWMAAGFAGGAAGALIVGRAIRGLLFGVSPLDPLALGVAAALLLASGALALLVPVRRAVRTEPQSILR